MNLRCSTPLPKVDSAKSTAKLLRSSESDINPNQQPPKNNQQTTSQQPPLTPNIQCTPAPLVTRLLLLLFSPASLLLRPPPACPRTVRCLFRVRVVVLRCGGVWGLWCWW